MLSHCTNVNISVQKKKKKKDLDTVKPSGCCPVHSTQSKHVFGPRSKEWQRVTLLYVFVLNH